MATLRPHPTALFPALTDLIESPWPFGEHNLVRIEEEQNDDNYVIRAELAGFDPDKGIHVTTQGGVLTISAERRAETKEKGHSEFRYGSFSRTISLPEGADPA